jgi:hypothetical protein
MVDSQQTTSRFLTKAGQHDRSRIPVGRSGRGNRFVAEEQLGDMGMSVCLQQPLLPFNQLPRWRTPTSLPVV